MTIKVLKYQSWFDLAIQATGTAENAFLIAAANGANVTEAPKAGTSIFIPDTVLPEKKTLSYYNSRNLKPASDVDKNLTFEDEGEGIEFWYVDYDFVVQ